MSPILKVLQYQSTKSYKHVQKLSEKLKLQRGSKKSVLVMMLWNARRATGPKR